MFGEKGGVFRLLTLAFSRYLASLFSKMVFLI